MTDHLAAELRGILDDLHDAEHGDVPKPLVRERLERLAEHVERLGADPVEVDASTELTASFGLEPDQEIRARGWQPAVPHPYWRRPWWRLFRLTPACYRCDRRPFSSREAYEAHWRYRHREVPR